MPFLLAAGFGLLLVARPPTPCAGESRSGFPPLALAPVAQGLEDPVQLTHAGDGSGRLFIVEQAGAIRILRQGKVQPRSFLDIRDRVESGGEKGLLSVAFHPRFAQNRRLYLDYTSGVGGLHTVISEFRVGDAPDLVPPASERVLLTIRQPYPNHNGGQLAFGPDGKLYIGMGDGGSANDPEGNGQNPRALLGKILRIDVDRKDPGMEYAVPPDNPFRGRDDAAPQVWAYGLRNPWRFSFDRGSGLLYAGDVGQNAAEEIDIIRRGKNYGWNIMEGSLCTPGVNPRCDRSGLELPIAEYGRAEGITVIGGFVYHGRKIPALCGAYLYGDWGSGRIWGLRYTGREARDRALLLSTHRRISSFGEDEEGELYVVDYRGEVLKIVPAGDSDR